MTVINHKSISGITSITAPAGSDDLLTVHTNDTTERFRIVDSGAIVTGVTTASNFKTGTSNLHNVGVEVAGINVLGADTPIGTGATIYNSGAAVFTGIVTATNLNVKSKVGIGTDNPSHELDIESSSPVLEMKDNDAGDSRFQIAQSGAQTYLDMDLGGLGSSSLRFRFAGEERVRFTTAGKVGISTNEPFSNLTVYGENRSGGGSVTGQITAKDNAAWNASPTGGIIFQGHYHSNNANAIFGGITGFKESTAEGNYAGALAFHVRKDGEVSKERLRIKSDGKVGINTTSPARMMHIFSGNTGHPVVLERGDTSNTQIELRTGGAVRGFWGSSSTANFMVYDNDASDIQFVVNQTGKVGLGIVTPSAGDLASGASFAAPKFHILGDNSQSGAYELLARFGSGTDADNTGSTIVLNHANDRGLAIQGGRSVSNRSYGALKSIDNVGRISDAIEIRGGNGQGVAHLAFYTGEATTTIQRLHITSNGHIVTQGLTGYSFSNDNNAKILEVTGDGTVGEYGQINISGNQNANAGTIGVIKFINRENSNGGSGSNASSRALGAIEMRTFTGDSNAGDDSGGYFRFILKPEGAGNEEKMRINNDGKVLIGSNSTPDSKLHITNGTLSIETNTTFYNAGENNENYPTIFFKGDHSSGNNPAHGKITVRHSNQNTYSGDILLMPQGYYSGSYGYQEVLRVSAYKRVGINEASPDRTLHISDASNGGVIRLTNTLTSINNGTICGMLEFEQRDSNTPGVSANIRAEMTDTTNGANQLCFSTGTPSTIGTRMTLSSAGRLSISGPGSQQLSITGSEADIWLNSSGPSTIWRILGSTGNNTHRFRIYDETNSRDIIKIYGENAGNETKDENSDVHIDYGFMIGKSRTRNSTGYGTNDVYHPVVSGGEGECVFSIDPSWSRSELRKFFNTDGVSWLNVGDAPGGYAIMVSGQPNVGGNYGSGFPYIPIDDGDSFRMECWIRTHNGSQNHYMGSIEYDKDFANGTGNPGSFGYWTMSNTTINSTSWTRVSGTLGPSHSGSVGSFRSGFTGGARKYWTPQALFNYTNNSGDRICYISGWRVIRLRHRGTHYFDAISKGSGSFKIDHPLSTKKDTHYLQHSFLEGPKADLIYRGKTTLVAGISTVNIDTEANMTDGTFVALNTDVQCHTTNETGWTATKGAVSGNQLTITAQDNACTDTISWMVIGERQDEHIKNKDTDWTDDDGKVIVELPKDQVKVGLSTAPMTAPAPST